MKVARQVYAVPTLSVHGTARTSLNAAFLTVETFLALVAACLAVAVRLHSDPLPYDVASERWVQQEVLPHKSTSAFLEFLSTMNWPLPSAIAMGVLLIALFSMGWRLAAIIALFATGLADGSNYLTSQLIRRPRPEGYGIHVMQQVKGFFSFPSGHVEHIWVFYGFLLYLSFLPQRHHIWLWPVRVACLILLLGILPSRLLEGEHWTSDVLAGLIYGLFWLVMAVAAYRACCAHWPRWRPRQQRNEALRSLSYNGRATRPT